MCYARSQTFFSYITAVRTEAFQLITQCNLWLHFVVFWQSHFRSLSLLNPEGVGENWRLVESNIQLSLPRAKMYTTVCDSSVSREMQLGVQGVYMIIPWPCKKQPWGPFVLCSLSISKSRFPSKTSAG